MDSLLIFAILLKQLLRSEAQNIVQLLLREVRALSTHAGPYDQMREHHLTLGHLRDSLLNRITRHEPIDHHLVRLSNTMGTRERLYVVVRIPIGIVNDDRVSRGQINTETTGASRKEEAKLRCPRCIETIDRLLTDTARDATVNALVLIPKPLEEILQDIQHLRHLREDQHSMTLRFQQLQHLLQQHQLAGSLCQRLQLVVTTRTERCLLCGGRKQVWMVAALFQIHHDVNERTGTATALRIQRLVVTRQYVLVVLLLQWRQLHAHNKLRLGRHVLQHIRL
uniref:Putative secreted protein n=1 Tax=Anopheles darlingi TaxID=43151 RepID=A0A2M4D870_ANODA